MSFSGLIILLQLILVVTLLGLTLMLIKKRLDTISYVSL